MLLGSGGENGHELLERLERLGGLIESGHGLLDVDEVGGEGRIVIGEVPIPRRYSLIVVFEHPL